MTPDLCINILGDDGPLAEANRDNEPPRHQYLPVYPKETKLLYLQRLKGIHVSLL